MDSAPPRTGDALRGFGETTAEQAMCPRVLACDPATPLRTVAQRLAADRIHALVLMTPSAGGPRVPIGMVTVRDVLRHADRLDELTADDVADRHLLEVNSRDRLSDVAAHIVRGPATHALVVDTNTRRLVGIISALDIARELGASGAGTAGSRPSTSCAPPA